jgi:hypothetical protein
VVDHVVAALPAPPAAPAAALHVPPAALIAALDAAPAGPAAATMRLQTAGVPADEAAEFVRVLGRAPARHALVALRGPRARPEQRGVLAIIGVGAAWCADDERSASVALRPLGPAGLRPQVADLVAWLAA